MCAFFFRGGGGGGGVGEGGREGVYEVDEMNDDCHFLFFVFFILISVQVSPIRFMRER